MRALRLQLNLLLIVAMLAVPALAEQAGVRWQHDLEAAKAQAKQSGRLVLVHFWTESCAPCVTLNQNVFNQAGVAAALEAQFVPVSLNANENPATAQGFGITRVPTDVILTADGQVVGMLISPPTPAGYVAEVTQIAAAHTSTPGRSFDSAAAKAPSPSQLNAAYANLQLTPETIPAISAEAKGASQPVSAPPLATDNAMAQAPAIGFAPPAVAAAGPNQIMNQYAAPSPAAGPAPGTAPPAMPATALATETGAATLTLKASPGQASPAQQPAISPEITPLAGGNDAKFLPTGAPPLGFDGYCPVTMRTEWKWVQGDARWGIVHRGRTYCFAGQEEQQQFWTDPDRFSPALSGMDPVMAVDHQQEVPGKREHSIDYDNQFYMFANEANLQQFTANPERYAAAVRQAMGITRGRLVR